MSKRIRDTIHGYIHLTALEEAVTQHPLVLRLHHIHQTSFTYLTYPNAHSTRYPHSLGVMHVAGEILRFAIRNTDIKTLYKLAEDVESHIGHLDVKLADVRKELESDDNASILNELLYRQILRFDHHDMQAAAVGRNQAPKAFATSLPLVVLYQAVRLAALLHDIGHPPYSHIVEYSLQDALSGEYLGHEAVGNRLVRAIIDDPKIQSRRAFKKSPLFCKLCMELALELLEANSQSLLYGLKTTLLSGDIDADRLDYVRRDCYSAGLVPVYDMRRLVESGFIGDREKGGNFEIIFQPNGISAVENFFMARYDLYRWMIYHHDVIRRNLSVQRFLQILFLQYKSLNTRTQKYVDDLKSRALIGSTSQNCDEFKYFNDAYFTDWMGRLYQHLETENWTDNNPESEVKKYLDVILFRRNDLIKTLIKGLSSYNTFASRVIENLNKPRSDDKIGPLHPESGLRKHLELDDNFELGRKLQVYINENANIAIFNTLLSQMFKIDFQSSPDGNIAKGLARVKFAGSLEEALNQENPRVRKGVKFYVYYTGAFAAAPKSKIVLSPLNNGHVGSDLRMLSPTTNALEGAWAHSPQLLIYFSDGPSGENGVDESRMRDTLIEAAASVLSEYLRDL